MLKRPSSRSLCLLIGLCPLVGHADSNEPASYPPSQSEEQVQGQSETQPWGYRVGELGEARQGNFCDDTDAALEIAQIFERFGARTGFSALSNAPACATRVHAVTPESLLRQVEIKLESGANYAVNFIQVQADDGSRPVLVTTRRLIQD